MTHLAEYQVLIWTHDPILDDILPLVLQRLGYTSYVLHSLDELDQLAAPQPAELTVAQPRLRLLIVGPHMSMVELIGAVRFLRQQGPLECVFLVRNTPPDDVVRTALPEAQLPHHPLPLNVRALDSLLKRLFE